MLIHSLCVFVCVFVFVWFFVLLLLLLLFILLGGRLPLGFCNKSRGSALLTELVYSVVVFFSSRRGVSRSTGSCFDASGTP